MSHKFCMDTLKYYWLKHLMTPMMLLREVFMHFLISTIIITFWNAQGEWVFWCYITLLSIYNIYQVTDIYRCKVPHRSHSAYLLFLCVLFSYVSPGVPAGASRDYPGHLGSFNRRAWQSARDQLAICLPEVPPGQLLPHHALPLQRVLCQHRSAAGL